MDKITVNEFMLDVENTLSSKHDKISQTKTPKAYVSQKQGFDYVDEGYMRKLLNDNFGVWSWEIKKYELLGDKVIVVHGRLTISDNGIVRYYDSVAAHRIAVSKTTGDYVDISNDLKSANTDAFKVAVNRLCNIADDVYRKQVADISLNEKQLDEIDLLLRQIDDDEYTMKINELIDDKSINSSNYDATIKRLNKQINK
tara:strand:+ start:384 stop:980 length:597 start_codon:yes stop_codon:yes gene_type:complete